MIIQRQTGTPNHINRKLHHIGLQSHQIFKRVRRRIYLQFVFLSNDFDCNYVNEEPAHRSGELVVRAYHKVKIIDGNDTENHKNGQKHDKKKNSRPFINRYCQILCARRKRTQSRAFRGLRAHIFQNNKLPFRFHQNQQITQKRRRKIKELHSNFYRERRADGRRSEASTERIRYARKSALVSAFQNFSIIRRVKVVLEFLKVIHFFN